MSDAHIIFPNEERANIEASFNGSDKRTRAKHFNSLSNHYPELEHVILDVVQPYSVTDGANAIGDMLWRVITADNIDKHRLIMPIVQGFPVTRLASRDGSFSAENVVIGNIDYLSRYIAFDDDADIAVDIFFEEPTRLTGKPVTSTLVEACDAVESVIDTFRSHFGGRKADNL